MTTNEPICLFNTLSRKKETFTPIRKGHVKIYTCGPTVYDYAHIGNFRAFLFEDILKRWLLYRGYKVTHIMNITDIDDKTIKGSQKKGEPLGKYTDDFTKAFLDDIKKLNIMPADEYPRATKNIPEMIEIIKKLLNKGIAYKGEDGSTYFSVAKFPDYGKLSHLKLGDLIAGARVSQDEYTKEQAQDFALWKVWTPEDGDVYWETELGKGRPGWHIECSAMSMKYLGETFDIHCGGIDNMFPHHENEIAQSEAATGKTFVNYWMHNEHLQVEGKKMSKRFGNFYTLRDLLNKGYDPITIRYLLISTHYRQQFNFTFEGLESAKAAVERLRNFVRRLHEVQNGVGTEKVAVLTSKLEACFGGSMDDDLNISIALASLFDFVREMNTLLDAYLVSKNEASNILRLMMRIDSVLGINIDSEISKSETIQKEIYWFILQRILLREAAKKGKNWKEADVLRQELESENVKLEDKTVPILLSGNFSADNNPKENVNVKVEIIASSGERLLDKDLKTDSKGNYSTKFNVSNSYVGGTWTAISTVNVDGRILQAQRFFFVNNEYPLKRFNTDNKPEYKLSMDVTNVKNFVNITGELTKNGLLQANVLIGLRVFNEKNVNVFTTILTTGVNGGFYASFIPQEPVLSPEIWKASANAALDQKSVASVEKIFKMEPSPTAIKPMLSHYKLSLETDRNLYQSDTIATIKDIQKDINP